MIKADLVDSVARELNISKQEAESGVNLFFDVIKEAILQGEEIEIRVWQFPFQAAGSQSRQKSENG